MTLHTILSALYLFLPAFAANAVPVLVQHVPLLRAWKTPIAPRLLGSNKTWRGLLVGVGSALTVGAGQAAVGGWTYATPAIHGEFSQSLAAALLLGLGALIGDAVESAAKRRMGIAPGRALPVADNIDYVVGGLLLLAPLYVPSLAAVIVLLILGPLLSLLSNIVSYFLGWKSVWW